MHIRDLRAKPLVKRRAVLAGEIEATHETMTRLPADLASLDTTIGQFDPTYKVEAIWPKGVPAASGLGA